MTMTKREKTLIFIVLILAVLFVYWMYFLSPTLNELGSLNAKIDTSRQTIDTNKQYTSAVDTLKEQNEATEEKIRELSGGVPSGFDQPLILVNIKDVVEGNALKVQYDFSLMKTIGDFEICPVKISMISNYNNLRIMLNKFEDGKFFVRVTGVIVEHDTTTVSDNQTEDQTGEQPTDQTGEQPAGQTIEQPAGQTEGIDFFAEPAPDYPWLHDGNLIKITLSLEYYNFVGQVSPDTEYPFSNGYDYGGDIFW